MGIRLDLEHNQNHPDNSISEISTEESASVLVEDRRVD